MSRIQCRYTHTVKSLNSPNNKSNNNIKFTCTENNESRSRNEGKVCMCVRVSVVDFFLSFSAQSKIKCRLCVQLLHSRSRVVAFVRFEFRPKVGWRFIFTLLVYRIRYPLLTHCFRLAMLKTFNELMHDRNNKKRKCIWIFGEKCVAKYNAVQVNDGIFILWEWYRAESAQNPWAQCEEIGWKIYENSNKFSLYLPLRHTHNVDCSWFHTSYWFLSINTRLSFGKGGYIENVLVQITKHIQQQREGYRHETRDCFRLFTWNIYAEMK